MRGNVHCADNSTVSSTMNIVVGESSGNVTWRIVCQRVAPSIRAASCTSGFRPATPAAKMRTLKPISFHPVIPVIVHSDNVSSRSQLGLVIPYAPSHEPRMPYVG